MELGVRGKLSKAHYIMGHTVLMNIHMGKDEVDRVLGADTNPLTEISAQHL